MLIRFHKPFGVLCQFRRVDQRPTLADFIDVPHVYPAGRLDFDSEGLLLLTDDGRLQARIAEPHFRLQKRYLVQVEAQPDDAVLERARARGIAGLQIEGRPAHLVDLRRALAPIPAPRSTPVTPHRDARSSWLEVILTEGRNRQVRRMLAALGMPVLRLIRLEIGPVSLETLEPGQWQAIPVPGMLR